MANNIPKEYDEFCNTLTNIMFNDGIRMRNNKFGGGIMYLFDRLDGSTPLIIFHKRSLVVIFTDMFSNGNREDLFSALQHLRYNKHEIILFHVKDKRMEENFEFSNRPHIFVDLESGREIKFSPNEIRETYKRHNHKPHTATPFPRRQERRFESNASPTRPEGA